MRNWKKKVLGGLLALIIIIGIIPISAMADENELIEKSEVNRYTVLVLDTSADAGFLDSNGDRLYTAATAIEYVKKASKHFIDSINIASGNNYLALVSYKNVATTVSAFTKDYNYLKDKISSLSASSQTRDISSGLKSAYTILEGIKEDNAIKNIVLFSTGMTNTGNYSYSGHYNSDTVGSAWYRTDTEVNLYAYANVAYEQAQIIKNSGILLYSVGLFQTMENMPEEGQNIAEFFKLTARELATSDDYFYSVDDPDKLDISFGEIADIIKNTISIYTSDKSLQIEKGDKLSIAFFKLDEEGMIDKRWDKMAITVSDPSIVLLSDYIQISEHAPLPHVGVVENDPKGIFSVAITGQNIGSTNVTISDTETGGSQTFTVTVVDIDHTAYTYKIDKMPAFYPDAIFDSKFLTNIYNMNGLFVNNYSCYFDDGNYLVSFDVYNYKYHTGAVDIYDAEGQWIDCVPIEKYTDITSLWDTAVQAFYLFADGVTGRGLTYEQAASSKKTTIERIVVPKGGYFTISNNFADSPGTFLYNSCDIMIEGALSLIEAAMIPVDQYTEIDNLIKDSIINDPQLKEAFMEGFLENTADEINDFSKNIMNGNISGACEDYGSFFMNLIDSMEIDWKHAVKAVTGLGEAAFEKLSGPAGIALKGCFALNEGTSKLLQVVHLGTSTNKPTARINTRISGKLNPYNVSVDGNGNIDKEAVLQVFRVSNDETISVVLDSDDPLEQYEIYNISFVKDEELVQPNGKVKVMLPIPADMAGDKCNVYRRETDGSWTVLEATKEGNYIAFYTDHFSLYAVVYESGQRGDVDRNGEITNADLVTVARYIVGLHYFTIAEKRIADINGDWHTDNSDLVTLARKIVGL